MIQRGSKEQVLTGYRNQAIYHAKSIQNKQLAEFMAYHNAPKEVLVVCNACLWILSGIYQQIEVNPITKDPLRQDWSACRKMLSKNRHNFLNKLYDIFDEIKDNEIASKHIRKVRQILSAHQELKDVKKISICGYALYQWMINVIKYWQIINQNSQ